MTSKREQAGLPTGPELRKIVLELLRKQARPVRRDQIGELVAGRLDLSEEQRAVRTPLKGGEDGPGTVVNWLSGWACNDLKQVCVCEQPARGMYQLTDDGKTVTSEEVERRLRAYRRERRKGGTRSGNGCADEGGNAWQQELLDRLLTLSPAVFEQLAGRLLDAAGFDEVQVTGKVADGGIDAVGIYRPSGLISFRTSVQCKRWQGAVGRDRIQAFQGASMPTSDRGIIITTGTFTAEARAQAQAPGAFPVDLVDGMQLAELLKEYELGVRTTIVELVTLNETYFKQLDDSS